MSLWHSPQVWESMKKLDGMISLVFVFAEDGKNGDFGPPPSSDMEVGTIIGFLMRSDGFGFALRHAVMVTGQRTMSARAAANAPRKRRQPPPSAPFSFALRQIQGASASTANPPVAMCAHKTQRFARTLPRTAR